jgi:hypothetical protein
MATLQQLNAAMSGFPRTLSWSNFGRPPAHPPADAQTGARFSTSSWTVQLVNGIYSVAGFRVTVSLNPAQTWATTSARSSANLLRHEQGHYDITGLIARDLLGKVLNLSFHQNVIAVCIGSGDTPRSHMQYVQRLFQADITRFGEEARSMLARLNTDPATGRDGIYDVQTNHSQNTAGQQAWNSRISRALGTNEDFGLMLRLEGIL